MKPPTLNKDGTPRKQHRKGAGRPNAGRVKNLPRISLAAYHALMLVSQYYEISLAETVEMAAFDLAKACKRKAANESKL